MNRMMKKILAIILVVMLSLGLFNVNAYAAGASVTIALSAGSISIGGTVTATINVSGSDISAYTIYVSYSSSIIEYTSASGSATTNGGGGTLVLSGTGAGATSVNFKAVANGTASISTSGSDVYDINENQISISHAGVNVVVETVSGGGTGNQSGNSDSSGGSSGSSETTEQNETPSESTTEENGLSNDCSLKSLQVSPGTLTPAFTSGTTKYTVRLDADATAIVVSASANDEKASTNVSGANSLKPGENTVRVTVTAENGAVRVYKINVICGEVIDDIRVTIDGKEYSFINDGSIPDVPEDFTESVITYNDLEIPAYASPNEKVKIVCLAADDEDAVWYIYDEVNLSFIPYTEYSSAYVRYVILKMPDNPDIPDIYHETQLEMDGMTIQAYTVDEATGIFLIYAINLTGDEGFYYYDTKEQAFMRYVDTDIYMSEETTENIATPDTATPAEPVIAPHEPDDDGIFTRQNLIYMLLVAAAISLLLLIIVIVLGVKNSKLKRHMTDAYLKNEKSEEGALQEGNGEVSTGKGSNADETHNIETEAEPDTGDSSISDFILEDADESAEQIFVPETKDKSESEIKAEAAVNERPYGIDSAFEVIPENEIKPEDGAKTDINDIQDKGADSGLGIEIPEAPFEED